MGLDTVILVLTFENVPLEVKVMDAGDGFLHEGHRVLQRPHLNRLLMYAGDHCLPAKNSYHHPAYELDGDGIVGLSSVSGVPDVILMVIQRFFESYLDEEGFEDEFAKNPTAGIPPYRFRRGYRAFMIFEG